MYRLSPPSSLFALFLIASATASAPAAYGQVSTYCTGKAGACGVPSISWTGAPKSGAVSGFVVQAAPARGAKVGILIYHDQGQGSVPFQGGTLCLAPMALRRTINVASSGTPGECDGVFSIDMNSFASGKLGGKPAPYLSTSGVTINAQWWARDTQATGSFLSDAIEWVVG